jgi:hypothetical protein
VVAGVVLDGVELPVFVFEVDDPQADTPAVTARLRPMPRITVFTVCRLSTIAVSLKVVAPMRRLGGIYG